jgi:hypothetical protein
MKQLTPQELIVKTLKEKSVLKQDLYVQTLNVFKELKSVIKEVVAELKEKAAKIDKRIVVDYKDKGEFEVELRIAGDVLFFYMHTNIFEFDKSHQIWKTSYVKEDNSRSYCGMINIFNFLADSFKYNRTNDLGYLIGRIFINKENHYFLEGKRQLGFIYNDFVNAKIDKEAIKAIVESAMLYCITFDLFTPPFDSVKEISVSEIQEASTSLQIKTGKRLGFRFQSDSDQID